MAIWEELYQSSGSAETTWTLADSLGATLMDLAGATQSTRAIRAR